MKRKRGERKVRREGSGEEISNQAMFLSLKETLEKFTGKKRGPKKSFPQRNTHSPRK